MGGKKSPLARRDKMETSFETNAKAYAAQMKEINPAWKYRVRKIQYMNAYSVEVWSQARKIWMSCKVF